mmetsp:Transcript_105010/g.306830  ORF Transcript_105010/g.306830 Transcript_105010/m.306830 type:complete len:298 (+) Transcript_105010:49-942(+)
MLRARHALITMWPAGLPPDSFPLGTSGIKIATADSQTVHSKPASGSPRTRSIEIVSFMLTTRVHGTTRENKQCDRCCVGLASFALTTHEASRSQIEVISSRGPSATEPPQKRPGPARARGPPQGAGADFTQTTKEKRAEGRNLSAGKRPKLRRSSPNLANSSCSQPRPSSAAAASAALMPAPMAAAAALSEASRNWRTRTEPGAAAADTSLTSFHLPSSPRYWTRPSARKIAGCAASKDAFWSSADSVASPSRRSRLTLRTWLQWGGGWPRNSSSTLALFALIVSMSTSKEPCVNAW